MSAKTVLAVAHEVRDFLAPRVEKVVVAGSIRRGNKRPGDVDLLVLPWFSASTSLAVELLKEALNQLRPPELAGVKQEERFLKFTLDGVKVDLLVSTHNTWGVDLLQLTGPREFNVQWERLSKDSGREVSYWDGYGDPPWREVQDFFGMSEMEILRELDLVQFSNPTSRHHDAVVRPSVLPVLT